MICIGRGPGSLVGTGEAVQQGVKMDAYGGNMERSLPRVATLIVGVVAACALLGGCASTAPGAVVIGTPIKATPAGTPPSGNFLAGLQAAITNELNLVNSTQSDSESPGVLIELQALQSVPNLIRSEQFTSLQTVGANQTAKREKVVYALIADVQNNHYLAGVDVAGAGLSRSLISMLNGVNAQLAGFAGQIAGAQMPDELRAAVLSMGNATRVYGLVEPMVHLAIAGGDVLAEVNDLAATERVLAGRVAAGAATDPNYAQETARLRDLSVQINTAREKANAAVSAALSLTAAGFPGNRATIQSSRAVLTQLRAPFGTLSDANGDVNSITSLLGAGV